MTTEKCIEILDQWISRNENADLQEISYQEMAAFYQMMRNLYFEVMRHDKN